MQFTYRAKQDQRTQASGVIDAVDLTAAVVHLRQMGLYPLEVVPLEEKGISSAGKIAHSALGRLALSLWARTLGQGLAAGLSLTQALHLLAEQEQGRPLGHVTKILEEQVTGGASLGGAMEQMGKIFSPVAVNLVRAGEASGALEQVLQALAEQVEQERELISKVQGALIYPFFVLAMGVGTVAFIIWVVFPKLTLLFAETGQPLPWLTYLMMTAGRGFLVGFGLGLLALAVLLFGNWRGWFKIPLVQWMMMGLSRLPIFRQMITQAEIARLSATLGLLLGHGLPLPEALRLGAGTVGRAKLKSQVQQSYREVVAGMSLSSSLRRVGLREPFLLTMVAMGEAQGDLGSAFQQAGKRYHEEVDRSVRVLSTLIEPMMILGVGVIVGAIVISMLLPIFQLNFTVE